MDTDPPSSPPKKLKLKFTPKAPPRNKTGRVLPESNSVDDDAATEASPKLLRKVIERLGTRQAKVDKKSSSNVTNTKGAGSASSSPMRTRSQSKNANTKQRSNLKESAGKSIILSSSTATKDDEMLVDDEFELSNKTKNVYKEPFDPDSYYPTILPWRPLGSGDPEILDALEFGVEKEYDENEINSAKELGLLENDEQQKLILFQFPTKLPTDKQISRQVVVGTKGKEKVESSRLVKQDVGLEDLPNGYMGKMLVYKSGAIKFKLGDVIFNVSPGIRGKDAQDVAMMNTNTNVCCVVGQLDNKAVVTPDLNSIFDNINKP